MSRDNAIFILVTVKNQNEFQARFGHFLTVYQDFCLKLESQNEQPLAHKSKRSKSRSKSKSPVCRQSKKYKNVFFGQKEGQIFKLPYSLDQ